METIKQRITDTETPNTENKRGVVLSYIVGGFWAALIIIKCIAWKGRRKG